MSNAGQARLIPGIGFASGQDVVAYDLFTDTDTTILTSHTASDGRAWAKHTGSAANDATIQANRAMNENAAAVHIYNEAWSPVGADYLVEADVATLTDNNAALTGVCARMAVGALTMYFAVLNANANAFQLYKYVAGVLTQLGSNVAQTPSAGVSYRLGLDVRGATIRLIADGAVVVTATDTAITAAGRAGIYLQNQATASTGLHLDNWRVVQ